MVMPNAAGDDDGQRDRLAHFQRVLEQVFAEEAGQERPEPEAGEVHDEQHDGRRDAANLIREDVLKGGVRAADRQADEEHRDDERRRRSSSLRGIIIAVAAGCRRR